MLDSRVRELNKTFSARRHQFVGRGSESPSEDSRQDVDPVASCGEGNQMALQRWQVHRRMKAEYLFSRWARQNIPGRGGTKAGRGEPRA